MNVFANAIFHWNNTFPFFLIHRFKQPCEKSKIAQDPILRTRGLHVQQKAPLLGQIRCTIFCLISVTHARPSENSGGPTGRIKKYPRFHDEMPKISENLVALFSVQLSHLTFILSLIIIPCLILFKTRYPPLNLTLF